VNIFTTEITKKNTESKSYIITGLLFVPATLEAVTAPVMLVRETVLQNVIFMLG